MLFGQFREQWNQKNDEIRFRFKSLVDDLLSWHARKNEVGDDALDKDTQRLISDIIGRVNEVRNRFDGNNSIIRDCLENLERDVLSTLGKGERE